MSAPIPFPLKQSNVIERVDSYMALQASVTSMEQAIAEAGSLDEAELYWTWALAMQNVLNRIVVQAGERLNELIAEQGRQA